jgi:predicted phosphoribosyltransferase
MSGKRFRDRVDAGRQLAHELAGYVAREDVVVLGLPRGGIPVASEIAEALRVPLDVFLVRKVGVPGHEELAMGAVASGGVRWLNEDLVDRIGLSPADVDEVVAREEEELLRRERLYRGDRPRPVLAGRTAILVDDGLATGATMRAAVLALRREGPAKIVVAVPTAAPESGEQLAGQVDELVCLDSPQPFFAVGLWYEDFSPVSDDVVRELLEAARARDATTTG